MKLLRSLQIVLLTGLLSACGEGPIGPQGAKGDQGAQGPQGEPGEIVETLPDFVGEYYMPFAGFVVVNINHEDEYSVDAQLISENPDDTLCVLDLDASTIDLHEGKIVYTGTAAMAAGNCKSDTNVALLTNGSTVTYQYEVTLSFNEDDLLEANLLIVQTSSGVKTVVIDRTLLED